MHLAEQTPSPAIVRILWGFEITKEREENGRRCGLSRMR
jgi:hypothetical protein